MSAVESENGDDPTPLGSSGSFAGVSIDTNDGFDATKNKPPPRQRWNGEQIEQFAQFYQRGVRQLRRWVKIGSENRDPCPLDDPSALIRWWAKWMSQVVPEDLFILASGGGMNRNAPGQRRVSDAGPMDDPPVDLSNYDVSQSDPVRQCQAVVAVVFDQLNRCYLNRSSDLDLIQRRYKSALDMLRTVEIAEREARRASGDLVPREDIEREAFACMTMLKQMRESMERQVIELCPDLTIAQRESVSAAIRRVRKREDFVLQRLGSFNSADELLAELRIGGDG